MKRIFLISFLALCLFGGTAFAAPINGTYNGHPIIKIFSGGKELQATDVPAVMLDGRTMVPIYLLQQLGVKLAWHADTQSVDAAMPEAQKTPEASLAEHGPPLTVDQIQALDKAVGYVTINVDGTWYFHGSGFTISSSGLFVTAYHVAEYQDQLRDMRIELNGQTYTVGKPIAADKEKDIFIAQLQGDGPFPYLKVSTDIPQKGDTVYALGNPDGQRNVLTNGTVQTIISDANRSEIYNSAKIDQGSSGGVLLNQFGEAIGITVSSVSDTGYYVAVSTKNVEDSMTEIFK